MQFDQLKRRELITLLGGAAAAWPLAARAQQGERMRRIGVLMAHAESDPEGQAFVAAFRAGLQKLGWTEGRNIRIDTRWAAEVELMQGFAKELIALQPDLILANNTPTTAAVLQQTNTIPIIFAVVADPELFKMKTGVDMVHVPYRGVAPALFRSDQRAGAGDVRRLGVVNRAH